MGSHLWATEVSSDRKNESRVWRALDTDRYVELVYSGGQINQMDTGQYVELLLWSCYYLCILSQGWTDQPDGYRTVCGAAISCVSYQCATDIIITCPNKAINI